jgi:hypothetical protein
MNEARKQKCGTVLEKQFEICVLDNDNLSIEHYDSENWVELEYQSTDPKFENWKSYAVDDFFVTFAMRWKSVNDFGTRKDFEENVKNAISVDFENEDPAGLYSGIFKFVAENETSYSDFINEIFEEFEEIY